MKYKFLYILGVIILTGCATSNKTIKVQESAYSLSNEDFTVNIKVDISDVHLRNTESIKLIPIIEGSSGESVALDAILLNGHNSHKVYERNVTLGYVSRNDYYSETKATSRSIVQNGSIITYNNSVAFAPWMREGRVFLHQESLDCCSTQIEVSDLSMLSIIPPPVIIPDPLFTYLAPARPLRKTHTEMSDIYLNFPVNEVVIYPNYMNNTEELNKAEAMVRSINDNVNFSIDDIQIVGHASPEGSVPSNQRLSDGRAAALKTYLMPKFENGDQLPIRSIGGGEGWDKTIELLEAASFNGRDELLTAIRNGDRSDAAETALKKIGGGAPYKEMLAQVYPKVRRVSCEVTYSVRDFTIEESHDIAKTNPELLSAYELYQVANSYSQESKEYLEFLLLAVKLYPDDHISVLNAALATIQAGKLDIAEATINKVTKKDTNYDSVYGLLLLQKGDLREALPYLQRATDAGIAGAEHNLSILKKRIDNEK